MNIDALRELPDHLLQEHAYCVLCHLPGCSDVIEDIIKVELDGLTTVSLHRRGVPETIDGVWSLPVEICWQEPNYDGWVAWIGPPVKQQVFLSQRVRHLLTPFHLENDVAEEGELMVPSIVKGAKKVLSIPMSRNPGGKNPDQSLMAPIGFCVLQNGNIAVASTFDHKVKLFNPKGVFITEVKAVGGNFERPSDMFTLTSGDFLVRDNTRLILFSGGQERSTGICTFVAVLWQEKTVSGSKYSGLAEDEEGRVVTIKEGKSEDTELLFFDLKSKRVTRRLGISHALSDGANSKCRFSINFAILTSTTDDQVSCNQERQVLHQ